MTRMTGGQALVEMLRLNGVDTIFALPGVQNDVLFAALHDARNAIRVIHTRHEQGAAYMAYGYAKASGRPGVYAVVPGPGVLNTTAALATAYAGNAKVLCLSGQIPLAAIGRGLGLLHEIPDQLAILRGLTKWAARIEHPADAPRLVNQAFDALHGGRPRPVALEMPMDVMAAEAEVEAEPRAASTRPALPDPGLIAKAASLLDTATKPLIVIGSGAMDAGAELVALAERLQAPVLTYQSGKGIVDARHPLAVSPPVGHRLWGEADVVIAVGTRLQIPQNAWGVDAGLKIIRIDIDPAEIARIRPPAVGIVADAKRAVAALTAALDGPARPSRSAEIAALRHGFEQEFAKLRPQIDFVAAIRDVLPEDGILVDELTQVGYVARFTFPVYRARSWINSGYQGTLGFGFATALGAKIACPDRAVVSISGDGGFMYNVQELATAALHNIPVVAIVFTDNAFGNVRRSQIEQYGGRVIATDLKNPDFARLAELFGVTGLRADGPAALRTALAAALARPSPTLIEVPVGEMPGPWHFIQMPRVRKPG